MLLEDTREEEGDGGWNRQVARLLQANPSPHAFGFLCPFVPFSLHRGGWCGRALGIHGGGGVQGSKAQS